MLKSLTIIGFVSLILGIFLTINNAYWALLVIFGFTMFILGLVLGSSGKKKDQNGPETVYCQNCGSVLTKGTQFCPYCGKKL
ncbi:MAG: zinc ribbon domain-containing protein [Promethearchaeota archaeon]|nr:MAG: zinc ribbon domain-containing protein [Candidatus Lokiarchaeota archaeon]